MVNIVSYLPAFPVTLAGFIKKKMINYRYAWVIFRGMEM